MFSESQPECDDRELERQVESIRDMQSKFLAQGLLGQYREAKSMRERLEHSLAETRGKLDRSSPSAVEALRGTQPAGAGPAPPLAARLFEAPLDNGSRCSAWVAPVASNGGERWPRYRWRLRGSACRDLLLEARGASDEQETPVVEICRVAVRLTWPRAKRSLLLPLRLAQVRELDACRIERLPSGVLSLSLPAFESGLGSCELLAAGFRGSDGFGVLDGFLTWAEADALRQRLLDIWHAGLLKPGEVEGRLKANIRSDVHSHLEDTQDAIVDIFARRLDQLILHLIEEVEPLRKIKLMRGRPMAAIYAGEGAKYTAHCDCMGGDNARVLTCIAYLNPFWQYGDGAELRIWPDARGVTRKGRYHDIAPLHGRLAVFLCDSRNLHEVLPVASQARLGIAEPRLAISCWYYNSMEIPRVAASERPEDAPNL